MFKIFVIFVALQIATVVATNDNLTPYSSSSRSRKLYVDWEKYESSSDECIDGTVALNVNDDVIVALSPFYVSVDEVISSMFEETTACNVTAGFPSEVECGFDFSDMDEEQEEAKNVCEEAGGKIFLYDLAVSNDSPVLSFSVDVVQFPVCIDKNCGIDGIAAIQEKATSDESLIPKGALIIVTPSCVEDPDAKFLFKTKTKQNGQLKPKKRTCSWLAEGVKKKRKRICMSTTSFNTVKPARDTCPESCCEFERNSPIR